jgi:hypothetical protein
MDSGIAGYHGGKLLCPHCFNDAQAAKAEEDDVKLQPIAFDEEEKPTPEGAAANQGTGMHAFSGDTFAALGTVFDDSKYNRKADPNSPAALRCRTFHSKLNAGALAYMNDQINTWADADPRICIKFASATIGVFEGKSKDQQLILTVFY